VSEPVTFELRDGTEDDLRFVFATWLRGHWAGQEAARLSMGEMRRDDYFALQHQRIDNLLASTARIRVAHPTGRPLVIAGWACIDQAPAVLHYVHVKEPYRRKGVARRLIGGRSVCTHLTTMGLHLKMALSMKYMPHLLDGP
jgi:GNAT superfamily N-acetyltransferase